MAGGAGRRPGHAAALTPELNPAILIARLVTLNAQELRER